MTSDRIALANIEAMREIIIPPSPALFWMQKARTDRNTAI
jgi:hypothetical protein